MNQQRQIGIAAADWLVRRNAGFSPVEETRFQEWISADPRHAASFDELAVAWNAVGYPGRVGQADVALERLRAREHRRNYRRRALAMGTVGLAVAVIAFGLIPFWSTARREPTASTVAVLEPERRMLSDGSTIELSAGTKIVVAFSPDKRSVQLLSGEALFAIAKDFARPFVVSVNGIEVRAVGTAFDVRFGAKQVDVIVTDGRVSLKRSIDGANLLEPNGANPEAAASSYHGLERPLLAAGERAVIFITPTTTAKTSTAVSVSAVSPRDIATALAWRGGRVQFTRAPLSEAVMFFNRQNKIQLSIADSSVARIPISGNLMADDPEGFARLLGQGFNIRSSRSGDLIILRLR